MNRYSDTPPLARGSIVDAAEHLIRTEGLSALTMRRLGRELGVEAMSLYHHVRDKREIEVTIVTRLLDRLATDRPSVSPSDAVERFARALRATLLANLELVPLVASVPPTSLRSSSAGTDALGRLAESGFDPESAGWIVDAVAGFVLGHAGLVAVADPSAVDHHDAVFETGLRFMLAGLRDELDA